MAALLPLSYITRGLRFIMGVEQLNFNGFILESTMLLTASLLIIFFVTSRSRWAE